MTVPDDRARGRLLTLTAGLSSVLVVCAVAGFVVGAGSDRTVPTASTTTSGSAALPLWVPDPTPTMTARPATQHAATQRPAASTPTPTPTTTRPPTDAERDRELAAWLASSGAAYAGVDNTVAGDLPSAVPPPDVAATAAPAGGTADGTSTGTAPTSVPSGSGGSTSGGQRSAEFVMSSFNVLGSSHTRNGARGRAPGVVRIRGAAQLLTQHDVGVAGFQELQTDQARGLVDATGGSWAVYPGAGSHRDSENSIGWRTSQFELVRGSTISIPYFNGHHRDMPYVLLRHRSSGVQLWVGNFHNPAETSRYHHQQRWRTQATYLEAGLATRLQATGAPVFLTGDMNERAPYFCRLTSAARFLVAAQGGSNDGSGCRTPRVHGIDWIFGSRGVTFSGYDQDRSPLVSRTTDHPVVTSRVRVGTGAFPRSVGTVAP